MSEVTEGEERPVLIAYDGSDPAKGAIAEAGRVLGADRRAVVLTVREPIPSFVLAGGGGATTLDPTTIRVMEEAARKAAADVAEEGARLAGEAGFAAEARAGLSGSAWQEIVAVADELDAGVIVIGSRGRSGFKKVLLGSVASAVVQHGGRSVLVVHPEASDAPGKG